MEVEQEQQRRRLVKNSPKIKWYCDGDGVGESKARSHYLCIHGAGRNAVEIPENFSRARTAVSKQNTRLLVELSKLKRLWVYL